MVELALVMLASIDLVLSVSVVVLAKQLQKANNS
jgi:hypothetical protein